MESKKLRTKALVCLSLFATVAIGHLLFLLGPRGVVSRTFGYLAFVASVVCISISWRLIVRCIDYIHMPYDEDIRWISGLLYIGFWLAVVVHLSTAPWRTQGWFAKTGWMAFGVTILIVAVQQSILLRTCLSAVRQFEQKNSPRLSG
jgi:hypothetical protein